jgi:hypothetical protein
MTITEAKKRLSLRTLRLGVLVLAGLLAVVAPARSAFDVYDCEIDQISDCVTCCDNGPNSFAYCLGQCGNCYDDVGPPAIFNSSNYGCWPDVLQQ